MESINLPAASWVSVRCFLLLDLLLTRLSSLVPTSLVLASLGAASLLSACLVPASFVLASLDLFFLALVASVQSFLATSPAPASLALTSPISPAPTSPAPASLTPVSPAPVSLAPASLAPISPTAFLLCLQITTQLLRLQKFGSHKEEKELIIIVCSDRINSYLIARHFGAVMLINS